MRIEERLIFHLQYNFPPEPFIKYKYFKKEVIKMITSFAYIIISQKIFTIFSDVFVDKTK
ncbi:hypothetical protein EFO35_06800 [Lactococcus cremoris]|nr:hypothetical protein [Lactococcus cremoris]MCT4454731.1 hypothetical protein [Lactococcus cremoris]